MSPAYTNATQIAADLAGLGVRATARGLALVAHHGMLLETRIKANASGRPGPNVITGDYRRSWTTQITHGLGGAMATVGTNKPQARRLEYGFYGVDALGRSYSQSPYPHVGPAVDAIQPGFERDIVALGATFGGTP